MRTDPRQMASLVLTCNSVTRTCKPCLSCDEPQDTHKSHCAVDLKHRAHQLALLLVLHQSAKYVLRLREGEAARLPETGPGSRCAHQPGPHQSWSGDQSSPHSSPDSAPTPGTLQVTVMRGKKSRAKVCTQTCSCWHGALDALCYGP